MKQRIGLMLCVCLMLALFPMRVISEADVLIVAGTSLNVYPAAGYLQSFRGRELVVINRDATPADADASLILREPVGEVLGRLNV